MLSGSKKYYLILVVFGLVYALVALLQPTDPDALERFGISSLQSRLLSMTIVVPYVLIWFAAFFGFIKLKEYAAVVGEAKEGPALAKLAKGYMILALALPITSTIASLLNWWSMSDPGMVPATTIVNNYLGIAFALVGFTFVAAGSEQLVSRLRSQPSNYSRRLMLTVMGAIATIFTYVTLDNPVRQFPSGEIERATYYLADWLIVLTIILPLLYIWFTGLSAAMDIAFYQKHAQGAIYRQFLRNLSRGFMAVIGASILLQILTGFSAQLVNLNLAPLLIIIYLLLIIISVGYLFIAAGAKRLARIEEV